MIMNVTVTLSSETAKRLSELATREGHTLESLLGNLAEHEAESCSIEDAPAEESITDEERPWRGVFILDYSQREIFRAKKVVKTKDLLSLPPEIACYSLSRFRYA